MSDATSVDPTAVLFGLEDEFSVLGVDRIGPTTVKMIIEQTAWEGPCPACGVLTSVDGPSADAVEGPAGVRADR